MLGHPKLCQITRRDTSFEEVDSQIEWKEQPSKRMSWVEIVRQDAQR